MNETDKIPERPSTGANQSMLQVRKQLEAVELAVESLRSADAPVPSALTNERYDLVRRLSSLEKSALEADEVSASSKDSTVFVIMPFADPFDEYYNSIIKPAVTDAGFHAARSDEIYRTGAFIQKIWTEILNADAVVAEMTGGNANVLYELGLCHAINRKVIMITQDIASVPSDLRHINCIVYDTKKVNWSEHLRNGIQQMLLFDQGKPHGTVLHPPASIDNADLFDRLEAQIQSTALVVRKQDAELKEFQDSLGAITDERDQYKVALHGHLVQDARGSAGSISIHEDGDVVVATCPLPGDTDTMLEFIRIPEGEFIFGGGSATRSWLPAYWITRHSVTNRQYCDFLNSIGLHTEEGVAWIDLQGESPADQCRIMQKRDKFEVADGYLDHPVTYVNYFGSLAFCEWIGGGLPSAEQWEKAARGIDGREYPWGSRPPNTEVANIHADGWLRDVPPINVRSKKKGMSPFGMIQPIGNVWHWTSTYYPDRGVQAVRGGSFFDFRLGKRVVSRFQVHPDGPDFSQGFVVVKRFLAGDT